MSEKPRFERIESVPGLQSKERYNEFPEHTPEEREKLDTTIEGYLAERTEPFTEVIDGDIDDILARYMEKGPELSPDVKISLRKTIRKMLGIKLQKEE